MYRTQNRSIGLEWDESGTLVRLQNRLNGQTVAFHNQTAPGDGNFVLVFKGGKRLDGAGMTCRAESGGENSFHYTHSLAELSVRWESDGCYWRRYMRIIACHAPLSYIEVMCAAFDDPAQDSERHYSVHQSNIREMMNFPGAYADCGQPVFFDGFFAGMEFPMALNWLDHAGFYTRFYPGSTWDGQSVLELYPWVIGASRSVDLEAVRGAFFDYLGTIGYQPRLRLQYNSWYDHMLNIDEPTLIRSFREIHSGFAKGGVTLDGYVLDDGWTNYESFWQFNEKFPDGLEHVQKVVQDELGAELGLWIGPRGGYGKSPIVMSAWLNAHPELELGRRNERSQDVDVGDPRYLEHLSARMLELQKKYALSYWKIDGLLVQPDFQYADETGELAFHHMTRVYERLWRLFEDLHAEAESRGSSCWLNLTSYVNPSPWWLMRVNSLWMQNSEDVGYEQGETHLQRMMTYRDGRYFEFLHKRGLALPPSSLYNHEPIYARTANEHYFEEQLYADVAEFELYLKFHATRGTAFWEFYYSYDMFDDARWAANGRVIKWVQENYKVLRESRMFGGDPSQGECYGYCCENRDEGRRILSLRNPAAQPQRFMGHLLRPYEILILEEKYEK